MLEDADNAENEVANVDIERTLRLLYRVNVLVDVVVPDIEFCQLPDLVELELLANGRPLRVLVGDALRRGCDSDRSSACPPTRPHTVDCRCNGGTGGGCNRGVAGDVGFSPMIKLVTSVAQAEPDVELERASENQIAALFRKDSFHMLCLFVTEDETGTG